MEKVKDEQYWFPDVSSKKHVMRFNLLFVMLLITSYSFSQDTVVVNDPLGLNLTKGYCGPFKIFRKNGTLKSEFYDNYNGNRVYYYYARDGRRKGMDFLYNVKWVRSYVPPCILE